MPRPYGAILEHRGVGQIPQGYQINYNPDATMMSEYGATWEELQQALASLNAVPTSGGDYTGTVGAQSLVDRTANVGPITVGGLFQRYGLWLIVGGLGLLLLKRR